MTVLPLAPIFEELRLTVTSAEIVLLSLKYDTELTFSCEISSLPTHNCNMIFRKSELNNVMSGQIYFRSNRPLVTAEMLLDVKNFKKLEEICSKGEPVRPLTLYLKIAKSREIKNGEVIIKNNDFTLDIIDLSWRRPLF
jgi:hypothetical protein